MTVPWHDTNDFYWSGHVGGGTVFALEYWRSGYNYWACFVGLIVVSEWFMLMSIRDHYIIDLNTGLMFAQFLHRYGEKTCYFYDVYIVGLP